MHLVCGLVPVFGNIKSCELDVVCAEIKIVRVEDHAITGTQVDVPDGL